MVAVGRKPLSWFKRDKNIRDLKPDQELQPMGKSLRKRQWVPLIARADGTILDGHQRHRAAELEGLEALDVIIVEGDMTPAQVTKLQFVTAVQRSALSDVEKVNGIQTFREQNPGMPLKQVGEELGLEPPDVTKLLSLVECIKPVQEAAAANPKITSAHWYPMSKLPPEEQEKELARILNGEKVTREDLNRKVGKAKNGNESSVRLSKLKLARPGGKVVTISGAALSLDDAITELEGLVREMKAASRENLDGRTFEKMCRDRSKGKGA